MAIVDVLLDGWEQDTAPGDSLVLAAARAMADRAAAWAVAAAGRVEREDGLVLADARAGNPFVNQAVSTRPVDLATGERVLDFYSDSQPRSRLRDSAFRLRRPPSVCSTGAPVLAGLSRRRRRWGIGGLRRARRRRCRGRHDALRTPRPRCGGGAHLGGDPRRSCPASRGIASDPGRGVYQRMGYLPISRWTLWYRA